MRIECSIEKLKQAVTIADRVTGKNLSLPILSTILCIGSQKQFKLRATNLSIGVEIIVPAKVEGEGLIAIKGEILSQLLQSVNGSQIVEIVSEDGNISFSTKQTKSLIKGYESDDFPTIPVIKGESFSIPSQKLLEGLKAVYYSAALSDIKPEIASVYIYQEGGYLVFVATDTFRLAEKKIKVSIPPSFPPLLIPGKNVQELIRIFQDIEDVLTVEYADTQVAFVSPENGLYVTSRLVNGSFPDYRQIMPKESVSEVLVLKQEFSQALKVSNIFSDKFNHLTIEVFPKEKQLQLTSHDNDIGEQKTVIPATCNGEAFVMSFNHKYITDSFVSLSKESISLLYTQSNRPLLLKAVGDDSFTYLIMPLNR